MPSAAPARADALVIGSGAGGTPVAALLAEAGLEVVLLEVGPRVEAAGFPADEAETSARLGRMLASQDGAQNFYAGACVGGSTVLNDALCWRPPPAVRAAWQRDPGLDPDGLAPWVERAWRDLGAEPTGRAGDGLCAARLRRGARALDRRSAPPGALPGAAARPHARQAPRRRGRPRRARLPPRRLRPGAPAPRHDLGGTGLPGGGGPRGAASVNGYPPVRDEAELAALADWPLDPSRLSFLYAVHLFGGAAMASSPAAGSCRPDGACWDVRGLYVSDAAALPGNTGVNPQVTIVANALRIAAGIAAREPA